jgi:hypothetical protein
MLLVDSLVQTYIGHMLQWEILLMGDFTQFSYLGLILASSLL